MKSYKIALFTAVVLLGCVLFAQPIQPVDILYPPGADYWIVGTATGVWAWESGATARNSLGLGVTDTVQFGNLTTLSLDATVVTATTTGVQLVLEYDGSNFVSFHAESDGDFTINSNKAGFETYLTDGSLVIGDARYIGSISDKDAIAIAADGKTTFTQDLTVNEDIIIGDAKTIGSASDTGILTLAADGSATFQPTADNTTAFQVKDADGGTSVLDVDSANERVGINDDSPTYPLDVNGVMQCRGRIYLQGEDASYPTFTVNSYSNTGWHSGFFYFQRTKGTAASKLAVASGDDIFRITTTGWDGDSYVIGSEMRTEVDGAVSDGIVPVRWYVNTMNTAGALATRLMIKSSGNVGIGESSPQDLLEVNGTGLFKDKLKFTQDDGNEYIDSDADGYLDLHATTAVRAHTGFVIPSGTAPAPAVVGAIFLDTDASANGDLMVYANGAWRKVVSLP